jgi:sulfonate transport system substrate-binding protein
LGFLAKGKTRPNLEGIYDLTVIDQVLTEKGLPTVEDAAATTTTTAGGGDNITTTTNDTATLPDVVS